MQHNSTNLISIFFEQFLWNVSFVHRKRVPGGLVQQPEAQHPLLPDGGKLVDSVGVPAQAVDGLVCFGAGQDDVATGTPHHHLIVAVITCTHTEKQHQC